MKKILISPESFLEYSFETKQNTAIKLTPSCFACRVDLAHVNHELSRRISKSDPRSKSGHRHVIM